jgi:hypothetical protein
VKVSTHINRSAKRMAVLSVALFACAVPAQAAAGVQIYRLHSQPESVPLVTDNSKAGTTDTAQVFRLHSQGQSVPLVTDNSGRTAATTASQNYGPLDPIIANAVRESKHPSAVPVKATTSTTFDWRDTGIGLAAFSALMALGFAGMTAKRRRSALA